MAHIDSPAYKLRAVATAFAFAIPFTGLLAATVLMPDTAPGWARPAAALGSAAFLIGMLGHVTILNANTDEYLSKISLLNIRDASLLLLAGLIVVGMLQTFGWLPLFPVLFVGPVFAVLVAIVGAIRTAREMATAP